MTESTTARPTDWSKLRADVGRIVLVFQGGGALGAYQAGVYEALHEAGIEPDWVIGTSIGAINAALIAGNDVENRLAKLTEFWRRVEQGGLPGMTSEAGMGAALANFNTVVNGIQAFFKPNPLAFLGAHWPLGPESAGYYSTAPLRETLGELIDCRLIARNAPRLTVGAANVVTGEMHYFDSRDMPVGIEHVMASGALPPAFPPVRIGGQLYWDGGILSNTPVEAVFDDNPRENSLVVAVHVWQVRGAEPRTMMEVAGRQKDVQYASRMLTHIARQKQLHRLRHIISELAGKLGEKERKSERVRMLASYGCVTRMHVVRLIAPPVEGEGHTKDIDFSREGIRRRRDAGREDTLRMLAKKPWASAFDPMEGFILHELDGASAR